jgi:phosphatidylinositol-3-phosphatase
VNLRQPIGGVRFAVLALLSFATTGIVVGAGAQQDHPSALVAAALHRGLVVNATPASPTTASDSGSAVDSSSASDSGSGSSSSGATSSSSSDSAPSLNSSSSSSDSSTGDSTTTTDTGTTTTTPPTPGTTTTAAKASKVKHVFVIALASPGYDQVFGPAPAPTTPADPYLTSLRPKGELLSNYSTLDSSDLANELALVSGQQPNAQTRVGCPTFSDFPAVSKLDAGGLLSGDGCDYPNTVLTLADQLSSAGLAWRAYAEDVDKAPGGGAKTCRHPDTNATDDTQQPRRGDQYAARHNPFVYFHSLVDLGDCTTNDVPLDRLTADLKIAAKTPNLVYVAPNLCHDGSTTPCVDGSPGGLASADAFLKLWVPTILSSPAYRKDGLLAITFTHATTQGMTRVGTLLLSRFVKPGSTSTTTANPYALLRTIEDLFALKHLGAANGAHVPSFRKDVADG